MIESSAREMNVSQLVAENKKEKRALAEETDTAGGGEERTEGPLSVGEREEKSCFGFFKK